MEIFYRRDSYDVRVVSQHRFNPSRELRGFVLIVILIQLRMCRNEDLVNDMK